MRPLSKSSVLLAFSVAVICLLSGCKVSMITAFQSDGSGNVTTEALIDKEYAPMVIPELRKKFREDASGKSNLPPAEELLNARGDTVFRWSAPFNKAEELSDANMHVSFETDNGLWQKRYRVMVEVSKNPDGSEMFEQEYRVRMPGAIEQTNGKRVSENEVVWSAMGGFQRGARFEVVSRGTGVATILALVAALGSLGALAHWLYSRRSANAKPEAAPVQGSSVTMAYAEQDMPCSSCGHLCGVGQKFCPKCGTRVSRPSESLPPPVPDTTHESATTYNLVDTRSVVEDAAHARVPTDVESRVSVTRHGTEGRESQVTPAEYWHEPAVGRVRSTRFALILITMSIVAALGFGGYYAYLQRENLLTTAIAFKNEHLPTTIAPETPASVQLPTEQSSPAMPAGAAATADSQPRPATSASTQEAGSNSSVTEVPAETHTAIPAADPASTSPNRDEVQREINLSLRQNGYPGITATFVDEQTVVLTGRVDNAKAKADIDELVAVVSGARVQNNISVTSATARVPVQPQPQPIPRPQPQRPDPAKLEGEINRALRNNGAGGITALVGDDLSLTLKGAGSAAQKQLAIRVSRSFRDIKGLRDQVFVVEQ